MLSIHFNIGPNFYWYISELFSLEQIKSSCILFNQHIVCIYVDGDELSFLKRNLPGAFTQNENKEIHFQHDIFRILQFLDVNSKIESRKRLNQLKQMREENSP